MDYWRYNFFNWSWMDFKTSWVEYDLQKKEAAYRKLLVIAEDDNTVRLKKLKNYLKM